MDQGVIMKFCSLFSGSSGNALYVESERSRVLVDAGLAGRTVTDALAQIGVDVRTLDGILISHEHIDHVRGAGILARRYGVPVYANERTLAAMPCGINIPEVLTRIFETEREFYIGDMEINTINTPHDAAESVCFSFTSNHSRVVTMTDAGYVTEPMLYLAKEAGLMLLEANHDVDMLKAGPYPYPLKRRILGDNGHLSNDAAGAALVKLYKSGLRRAVLGHLSKENNLPSLALKTVESAFCEADIYDFEVAVAPRETLTEVYNI